MTGHRPFAKIRALHPEDVTTDEVMEACDVYCRTQWGHAFSARASVLMVLQALQLAGYRVVRR